MLSKWNEHKMYWRFVMTMFLLCPRTYGEIKNRGEAHADTHDINSAGKSLNISEKLSLDNESTRIPAELTSKNKTSAPVKPKPTDTTIATINVMVGETQRGNNVDSVNFGAVLRGFYVFLGLSVIVIMYFTVRAIRLGRKKTKVEKYGILASREDLEMTPLGAEEEEDDTTIFDLSSHPVR